MHWDDAQDAKHRAETFFMLGRLRAAQRGATRLRIEPLFEIKGSGQIIGNPRSPFRRAEKPKRF